MLKRVNKERTRCPVVFYEEIIAVFKLKESQIGTEIDKSSRLFELSKFLCSFCQIFDRLRALEYKKGQQGKSV